MDAHGTRDIGHVRVLFGAHGGKYPDGNALLVRGAEESLLVDPALGLHVRAALPQVDRVVLSHCHEDHIAGNPLFADRPLHVHAADRPGLASLDGMMAIFGYDGEIGRGFRKLLVDTYHYQPRPDARPYEDGAVFDLGGGVTVTAIHAPGHTRGHCLLHVAPDDVLYLGDIDLSSFGPYYGDAWSCLEDFEATLRRVRALHARHYATFHHVGVLDGREAFLERFDRFAAVIGAREARLLAFLDVPRGLDEIAAHRFVFRPGDAVPFADPVERRSMGQHLERLVAAGRVEEVEPGRFLRRGA